MIFFFVVSMNCLLALRRARQFAVVRNLLFFLDGSSHNFIEANNPLFFSQQWYRWYRANSSILMSLFPQDMYFYVPDIVRTACFSRIGRFWVGILIFRTLPHELEPSCFLASRFLFSSPHSLNFILNFKFLFLETVLIIILTNVVRMSI